MRYDEFILHVQQRAGFATHAEAVQATEATLSTLGERLSRLETRRLATQLPKELQAYLDPRQESQLFDLEEFFNCVSARTKVRRGQAVNHARAVIAVLCEAVSPGEIEDVRLELTPAYDPLFQEASL